VARLFLSVIIPAYNEEARIEASVRRLAAYLAGKAYAWEVAVVDDGSTDRTADIVSELAFENPKVRLLRIPHGGKGAAVRHGMLESDGEWRFLCDADLSMPPEQIDRFFEGDADMPRFDVSIGSREAPGARRFDEPFSRHFIGRAYNRAVRILAIRGLDDTQCGFKLYRGDIAHTLFKWQRLPGFAFDVEVLFLARKAGFTIGEIGIDWYYYSGSKVTLSKGASAFADILRVRLNDLMGRYSRLRSG